MIKGPRKKYFEELDPDSCLDIVLEQVKKIQSLKDDDNRDKEQDSTLNNRVALIEITDSVNEYFTSSYESEDEEGAPDINYDYELMREVSQIDIQPILEQLSIDDYIRYDNKHVSNENKLYYATFKGRRFKGYEQTEKDKQKADLQAKANQRAILFLTLVVALGTLVAGLYYATQLIDYTQNHFADWSGIVYFLTGLCTGLLIWLISVQLKRLFQKYRPRRGSFFWTHRHH